MTGREAFARDYDVPRETMEKLDRYAAMLSEAAQRFNLVALSTLPHLWDRHFADSAQLLDHGQGDRWLDLGSGAGLPGMVLAILGQTVDLVEATGKKAAFLGSVVNACGLQRRVQVVHARVEHIDAWSSPLITARAFAPLSRLFDLGLRFADARTRWVLLKGGRVDAEIEIARRSFEFEVDLRPSRTSADGRVLLARSVRRKVLDAAVHR